MEIPTPSPELKKMLDEIGSVYEKAATMIPKIYNKAVKEGFSPKQAYKLILERTHGVINPRTVRMHIPKEAKTVQRTTNTTREQSRKGQTIAEELKSKTQEERADFMLERINESLSDPSKGALAKYREVAKHIHWADKIALFG